MKGVANGLITILKEVDIIVIANEQYVHVLLMILMG